MDIIPLGNFQMKNFNIYFMTAAVLAANLLLTSNVALAGGQGGGNGKPPPKDKCRHDCVAVPEIHAEGAAAGLLFVLGGIAVMTGTRRRRS